MTNWKEKLLIGSYWLIMLFGTGLFAGFFLANLGMLILTWGPSETEVLIMWLQGITFIGLFLIACLGTVFSMMRLFDYIDNRGIG